MRRLLLVLAGLALAALTLPAAPGAHPERDSFYPNGIQPFPVTGKVPEHRSIWKKSSKKDGERIVVCKGSKSKAAIKSGVKGKRKRANLKLLRKCKFHDIQAAVNKAKNNARILVLPGVYEEHPSRSVLNPDPKCKGKYKVDGENVTGSYEYHRDCPNSQNLIAIVGDGPDNDRRCDDKCNIQIEGTGDDPKDVLIRGQRSKLNVIRADRADGIYLRNFEVTLSDFNNIYALETNGFVFDRIVSSYSREYGFLTFTSDNGLYTDLEAYGSGDSGIYPGSGPEGHCRRYGIEIRNSNSHDNTIGYSGTAGNGVWAHDNKFHHNGTGITTDSFAAGHPGMPQDCAKWEKNEIYSNNENYFTPERDAYCDISKRPILQRDPTIVCPTFQVPVGTGIGIFGGNGNVVRENYIYDNWRDGAKLMVIPAVLRGDDPTNQSQNNPGDQIDTSLDNTYSANYMGIKPDGTRAPNGNDFWWDEGGKGNCWDNNKSSAGSRPTSNVLSGLPSCGAKSSTPVPPNPLKSASQVSCATWDPQDEFLRDPPGCDWFVTPRKPGS